MYVHDLKLYKVTFNKAGYSRYAVGKSMAEAEQNCAKPHIRYPESVSPLSINYICDFDDVAWPEDFQHRRRPKSPPEEAADDPS